MVPDYEAIAIRLADEGVPLAAIGRAFKQSTSDFRGLLHEAVASGRLVTFPREDWSPRLPRDERVPAITPKQPSEDNAVLIINMIRTFRTTRLQSKILLQLLRRGHCTKEMIHDTVEDNRGNPSEPTNEKIVDVIICHLRKKLRPFGLLIKTMHAVGYYMPEPDRDKTFKLLYPKEVITCPVNHSATTPVC